MAGRAWVFTIHVDSVGHGIQTVQTLQLENIKGLKFFVAQIELAPTTQAPHVQGYINFDNSVRFSTLKKLLGDVAHIERAKGSAEQNYGYCTKLESRAPDTEPVVWGELPKQGRRTDLEEVAEAVAAGATRREIAESFPKQVIQYGRGIERLREWRQSELERVGPVNVRLLWGPPGTGKTRAAYEAHGAGEVYQVVDSGARFWWDGYDPGRHTCVLFDDFNGSHSLNLLLQWLDRYPVRGEVKGGTVPLVFTHCVITTNLKPAELWQGAHPAQRAAFFRRVTDVTEVAGGNTMPPPLTDNELDDFIDGLSRM